MSDLETALTLALPGPDKKRGFSETVDLDRSQSTPYDIKESAEVAVSGAGKPSAAKSLISFRIYFVLLLSHVIDEGGQLVGWPPVRSFRRNAKKSCSYVKVAVDGAPYLRKVDLEAYNGYQQLLSSLPQMFTCFTLRNYPNEVRLVDPTNGTEYVPTYEDKDGDWMLVGDVPWKMFITSCKRLRLMKSSEAVNLSNYDDFLSPNPLVNFHATSQEISTKDTSRKHQN